MSYLSISNLYKCQDILLFKEAYALEKCHGTSAHLRFIENVIHYFSGGEKHEKFKGLFNEDELFNQFKSLGHPDVTIYGEAYGGKCQGMSETYGKDLRFICFDVKIGETWLCVPDAEQIVNSFGLEFVPYDRIVTELFVLDNMRDKQSEVAIRRGMGDGKVREGIILRPLIELIKNNGERIIAKHKSEQFSERATPQKIVSPEKLKILSDADAIANEWVTEMRLSHILDKMGDVGIENVRDVIITMVSDVEREASGEIVVSPEAKRAIGARTAKLFKNRLNSSLYTKNH